VSQTANPVVVLLMHPGEAALRAVSSAYAAVPVPQHSSLVVDAATFVPVLKSNPGL